MTRLLLPLLAATTLWLASCSGSDEPAPGPVETTPAVAPTTVAPGACIASPEPVSLLGDVAISESTVVDCDEPHVYEVLVVQDVPPSYFADPTGATELDRIGLQAAADGSPQSAIQIQFAAFARTTCAVGLQRAVGLADLELAGEDGGRLAVAPVTDTSAAVAVLPSEGWADQPVLVCVNRFSEPSADPVQAPASPVTGLTTPSLLSPEVPAAERECFAFDSSGLVVDTTCEQPHFGEFTVRLDATFLLDDEQLANASVDASAPFDDEVQEQIDQACDDVLGRVIGEDYDEDLLAGHGLRGAAGWGQGGTVNSVTCYVSAADDADFDLPAGSVIGIGDTEIELSPVA
ncbi:hypothetical protein [Aeromicrobium marinum]|uniref:hypothetical protein n=1 Tax=Aeromicrobium marinum TaxID=219314 RepID=UPI000590F950|nr:hypothetical protein [Aeromicrobium marinum]